MKVDVVMFGLGFFLMVHVNIAHNFTEKSFIYHIKDVKAQITQKRSHSLIKEF